MDIALSEEQAMLRDTLRRFLADRLGPTNLAKERMVPEDWRALGELGLFAFLMPERAGGMDGALPDIMIVAEEFGRSLAITPLTESVLLCAGLIARQGTQAQIERWVAPIMRGDAVLAFVRGGRLWDGRLEGNPGLVRHGAAAATFVVATEDGSVALVDSDADGLVRRPVRLVDGSIAADLRFDGVPCESLAASPQELEDAIGRAELANVAEMVGAMSTLLDLTVDYVKQRKQFGQPIGSFQAIQHRCARLYVLLEQSRSMLLKAALAESGGWRAAVTAARAYVADAALRLAEESVQLHGGMGITEELAVGRGLRVMLLLSRLFGGGAAARAALAASSSPCPHLQSTR